jgi:hypothetical protein
MFLDQLVILAEGRERTGQLLFGGEGPPVLRDELYISVLDFRVRLLSPEE